MNTNPQTTLSTPPGGILSRRWAQVTVMVVGFAIAMIVSNSIATAL